MLLALSAVDYGMLGFYLLVMLLAGFYFSRQQHSARDFFLAGRSMGWLPVGVSVMATLLSAVSYAGIPGQAYYQGLRLLILPVCVWLTLPVMWWMVLPLFHRLKLVSVYEYLELRFNLTCRICGGVIFVAGRLLWLGCVLYAPCKVLVVASGMDVPVGVFLVLLGAVSTAYTCLGGMKAVVWTDVVQAVVMAAGLVLVIGGVWWALDGGAGRVWEVSQKLGRTEYVQPAFSWGDAWSVWGCLPHFFLVMLSFYVADQITAQRFLAARSLTSARISMLLNCVAVSLMLPALVYAGIAVMTYYYDQPQAMRAVWVANVDNTTSEDPRTGAVPAEYALEDGLNTANVDELIAAGKLLRPNTKEPFTSASDVLVDGQIDVNALAMRRPPVDGLTRGEMVLRTGASDEMLPAFWSERLMMGATGLLLMVLLAASMSSLDSGLHSIGSLLITDYYQRLGAGRALWARLRRKQVDQLDDTDELALSRYVVMGAGVMATAGGLLIAASGDIVSVMLVAVNTLGGPLLAMFLLGMFYRRATAAGALLALLGGMTFTVWMMVANQYEALRFLWPFQQTLSHVWPLICGAGVTVLLGVVLSLFIGRKRSRQELRGLVFGNGPPGERVAESAALDIGKLKRKQ